MASPPSGSASSFSSLSCCSHELCGKPAISPFILFLLRNSPFQPVTLFPIYPPPRPSVITTAIATTGAVSACPSFTSTPSSLLSSSHCCSSSGTEQDGEKRREEEDEGSFCRAVQQAEEVEQVEDSTDVWKRIADAVVEQLLWQFAAKVLFYYCAAEERRRRHQKKKEAERKMKTIRKRHREERWKKALEKDESEKEAVNSESHKRNVEANQVENQIETGEVGGRSVVGSSVKEMRKDNDESPEKDSPPPDDEEVAEAEAGGSRPQCVVSFTFYQDCHAREELDEVEGGEIVTDVRPSEGAGEEGVWPFSSLGDGKEEEEENGCSSAAASLAATKENDQKRNCFTVAPAPSSSSPPVVFSFPPPPPSTPPRSLPLLLSHLSHLPSCLLQQWESLYRQAVGVGSRTSLITTTNNGACFSTASPRQNNRSHSITSLTRRSASRSEVDVSIPVLPFAPPSLRHSFPSSSNVSASSFLSCCSSERFSEENAPHARSEIERRETNEDRGVEEEDCAILRRTSPGKFVGQLLHIFPRDILCTVTPPPPQKQQQEEEKEEGEAGKDTTATTTISLPPSTPPLPLRILRTRQTLKKKSKSAFSMDESCTISKDIARMPNHHSSGVDSTCPTPTSSSSVSSGTDSIVSPCSSQDSRKRQREEEDISPAEKETAEKEEEMQIENDEIRKRTEVKKQQEEQPVPDGGASVGADENEQKEKEQNYSHKKVSHKKTQRSTMNEKEKSEKCLEDSSSTTATTGAAMMRRTGTCVTSSPTSLSSLSSASSSPTARMSQRRKWVLTSSSRGGGGAASSSSFPSSPVAHHYVLPRSFSAPSWVSFLPRLPTPLLPLLRYGWSGEGDNADFTPVLVPPSPLRGPPPPSSSSSFFFPAMASSTFSPSPSSCSSPSSSPSSAPSSSLSSFFATFPSSSSAHHPHAPCPLPTPTSMISSTTHNSNRMYCHFLPSPLQGAGGAAVQKETRGRKRKCPLPTPSTSSSVCTFPGMREYTNRSCHHPTTTSTSTGAMGLSHSFPSFWLKKHGGGGGSRGGGGGGEEEQQPPPPPLLPPPQERRGDPWWWWGGPILSRDRVITFPNNSAAAIKSHSVCRSRPREGVDGNDDGGGSGGDERDPSAPPTNSSTTALVTANASPPNEEHHTCSTAREGISSSSSSFLPSVSAFPIPIATTTSREEEGGKCDHHHRIMQIYNHNWGRIESSVPVAPRSPWSGWATPSCPHHSHPHPHNQNEEEKKKDGKEEEEEDYSLLSNITTYLLEGKKRWRRHTSSLLPSLTPPASSFSSFCRGGTSRRSSRDRGAGVAVGRAVPLIRDGSEPIQKEKEGEENDEAEREQMDDVRGGGEEKHHHSPTSRARMEVKENADAKEKDPREDADNHNGWMKKEVYHRVFFPSADTIIVESECDEEEEEENPKDWNVQPHKEEEGRTEEEERWDEEEKREKGQCWGTRKETTMTIDVEDDEDDSAFSSSSPLLFDIPEWCAHQCRNSCSIVTNTNHNHNDDHTERLSDINSNKNSNHTDNYDDCSSSCCCCCSSPCEYCGIPSLKRKEEKVFPPSFSLIPTGAGISTPPEEESGINHPAAFLDRSPTTTATRDEKEKYNYEYPPANSNKKNDEEEEQEEEAHDGDDVDADVIIATEEEFFIRDHAYDIIIHEEVIDVLATQLLTHILWREGRILPPPPPPPRRPPLHGVRMHSDETKREDWKENKQQLKMQKKKTNQKEEGPTSHLHHYHNTNNTHYQDQKSRANGKNIRATTGAAAKNEEPPHPLPCHDAEERRPVLDQMDEARKRTNIKSKRWNYWGNKLANLVLHAGNHHQGTRPDSRPSPCSAPHFASCPCHRSDNRDHRGSSRCNTGAHLPPLPHCQSGTKNSHNHNNSEWEKGGVKSSFLSLCSSYDWEKVLFSEDFLTEEGIAERIQHFLVQYEALQQHGARVVFPTEGGRTWRTRRRSKHKKKEWKTRTTSDGDVLYTATTNIGGRMEEGIAESTQVVPDSLRKKAMPTDASSGKLTSHSSSPPLSPSPSASTEQQPPPPPRHYRSAHTSTITKRGVFVFPSFSSGSRSLPSFVLYSILFSRNVCQYLLHLLSHQILPYLVPLLLRCAALTLGLRVGPLFLSPPLLPSSSDYYLSSIMEKEEDEEEEQDEREWLWYSIWKREGAAAAATGAAGDGSVHPRRSYDIPQAESEFDYCASSGAALLGGEELEVSMNTITTHMEKAHRHRRQQAISSSTPTSPSFFSFLVSPTSHPPPHPVPPQNGKDDDEEEEAQAKGRKKIGRLPLFPRGGGRSPATTPATTPSSSSAPLFSHMLHLHVSDASSFSFPSSLCPLFQEEEKEEWPKSPSNRPNPFQGVEEHIPGGEEVLRESHINGTKWNPSPPPSLTMEVEMDRALVQYMSGVQEVVEWTKRAPRTERENKTRETTNKHGAEEEEEEDMTSLRRWCQAHIEHMERREEGRKKREKKEMSEKEEEEGNGGMDLSVERITPSRPGRADANAEELEVKVDGYENISDYIPTHPSSMRITSSSYSCSSPPMTVAATTLSSSLLACAHAERDFKRLCSRFAPDSFWKAFLQWEEEEEDEKNRNKKKDERREKMNKVLEIERKEKKKHIHHNEGEKRIKGEESFLLNTNTLSPPQEMKGCCSVLGRTRSSHGGANRNSNKRSTNDEEGEKKEKEKKSHAMRLPPSPSPSLSSSSSLLDAREKESEGEGGKENEFSSSCRCPDVFSSSSSFPTTIEEARSWSNRKRCSSGTGATASSSFKSIHPPSSGAGRGREGFDVAQKIVWLELEPSNMTSNISTTSTSTTTISLPSLSSSLRIHGSSGKEEENDKSGAEEEGEEEKKKVTETATAFSSSHQEKNTAVSGYGHVTGDEKEGRECVRTSETTVTAAESAPFHCTPITASLPPPPCFSASAPPSSSSSSTPSPPIFLTVRNSKVKSVHSKFSDVLPRCPTSSTRSPPTLSVAVSFPPPNEEEHQQEATEKEEEKEEEERKDAEAWEEVGSVLSSLSTVFSARSIVDESAWDYDRNHISLCGVSYVGVTPPPPTNTSLPTALPSTSFSSSSFSSCFHSSAPISPSFVTNGQRKENKQENENENVDVVVKGLFFHEKGLLYSTVKKSEGEEEVNGNGNGPGRVFAMEVFEEPFLYS